MPVGVHGNAGFDIRSQPKGWELSPTLVASDDERTGRLVPVVRGLKDERTGRLVPVVRV